VALVGWSLLPFVEFRPNRIVDGVQMRVWAAAGPWTWVLLATLLAGLASAFAPAAWRGRGVLGSAVASFVALLFALGFAATRLTPPGDSPVRVSIGAGAWIVSVGVAALWFQGSQSSGSSTWNWVAGTVGAAAVVAGFAFGGLAHLSLIIEYQTQKDTFWWLTYRHVLLTLGGTAIAAVIGVPLGIAAARTRFVRYTAIPAVSVIQTVPSLALFGLLMVPLAALGLPSIGTLPTLIALTLYALLPIVRNTFLGVTGVDAAVVDAGRGMGMSGAELLLRVELPLGLPLLLEGLRAALVLTVGIAAVMAIGGAQDLGTLVFTGFGEQATDLVLLGAIPMVVLSIFADQGMRALERAIVSPGIREKRSPS
jgi:osmoprotectant transport system permease protein